MAGLVAFLTLITLFAGACATGPETARNEESALRGRVEAFWAAKARGDWKTAETYVDPDLKPEVEPYFKQLREGPHFAEFKSVEITEVMIQGGEAEVNIKYSVKYTNPLLPGMPVMDRQTKEAWRKKRGVWYVVMQRPDPSKIFQRFGPKEGGR